MGPVAVGHRVPERAAVDVAQAHEDQPPDRLRTDLHVGREAPAQELEFAEEQPHEAAEGSETHIDQRGQTSAEARAIDKLIHSFTTDIERT